MQQQKSFGIHPGGPWSGWSWTKASLPSRRGGINLRSVSVWHTHTTFRHASDVHSQTVTESMLSQELGPSPHFDSIVTALSVFASGSDWLCNSVWRILTCHCTSSYSQLPLRCIMRPCFSTFSQQHHPPIPGPFCPMLVISSMAFRLPHWNGSSPLGPSVSLLSIHYWLGVPLHCSSYSCPECHNTADPFGDHQDGCGGNGDQAQCRSRCHLYSAAQSAALAPVKEMPNLISDSLSLSLDLLMSFFPPEAVAGWLLLMYM